VADLEKRTSAAKAASARGIFSARLEAVPFVESASANESGGCHRTNAGAVNAGPPAAGGSFACVRIRSRSYFGTCRVSFIKFEKPMEMPSYAPNRICDYVKRKSPPEAGTTYE
jgi:hypothetical protein